MNSGTATKGVSILIQDKIDHFFIPIPIGVHSAQFLGLAWTVNPFPDFLYYERQMHGCIY
jgi:hypothetical protein